MARPVCRCSRTGYDGAVVVVVVASVSLEEHFLTGHHQDRPDVLAEHLDAVEICPQPGGVTNDVSIS